MTVAAIRERMRPSPVPCLARRLFAASCETIASDELFQGVTDVVPFSAAGVVTAEQGWELENSSELADNHWLEGIRRRCGYRGTAHCSSARGRRYADPRWVAVARPHECTTWPTLC
jgi:hypothetical protein